MDLTSLWRSIHSFTEIGRHQKSWSAVKWICMLGKMDLQGLASQKRSADCYFCPTHLFGGRVKGESETASKVSDFESRCKCTRSRNWRQSKKFQERIVEGSRWRLKLAIHSLGKYAIAPEADKFTKVTNFALKFFLMLVHFYFLEPWILWNVLNKTSKGLRNSKRFPKHKNLILQQNHKCLIQHLLMFW